MNKLSEALKFNNEIMNLNLNQKVMIAPVKNPILNYHSTYSKYKSTGRGSFCPAEYNLYEIGRIADVDSYVRQAFEKKSSLIFKEGYSFVGKNPTTIKYIQSRFEQMFIASGLPFDLILRDIGRSIVEKSNAFLVKVRSLKSSGGKIRKIGSKKVEPIAAYFTVPAETMNFLLDNNENKIVKWQQKTPNNQSSGPEFDPEDIIHFYHARKDGFVFGTPSLIPVIEDVRSLRKIEENVELLIYQHLFPLFQYIVGTDTEPAGKDENGNDEIEVARNMIMNMPSEGGIVTSHRHSINIFGAEGRALDVSKYLDHFKERVFAGLTMSAVDFGIGYTANKSTADTMSRNLVDSIKDYQQAIMIFFNNYIIKELLLEGEFDFDPLASENICALQFKEIDIDAQVKKENHHADLFQKDALTWDEMRMRLGVEPIEVPGSEDLENATPEQYPEWFKTKWKLFTEPQALIQAIDEPWSPQAKAAAMSRSTELESTAIDVATTISKEIKAPIKSPTAPKKTGSTSKDYILNNEYKNTVKEVVRYTEEVKDFDLNWTKTLIKLSLKDIPEKLLAEQMIEFKNAYTLELKRFGSSVVLQDQIAIASVARKFFKKRTSDYVERLINNINDSIDRKLINNIDRINVTKTMQAIFDSYEFRTTFIEDVEIEKSKMLGRMFAWKNSDVETVYICSLDNGCDICQINHLIDINLSMINNSLIKSLDIDMIPPFHAGCKCILTPKSPLTQSIITTQLKERHVNLEDDTIKSMVSSMLKVLEERF